MSRSEQIALAAIERGRAAGMSEREALLWHEAVRSPCGCAEGLAAGSLLALGRARSGSGRSRALAAFALGALVGKVFGVARRLPLVRFQRAELERRVSELTTAG